MLVSSMMRQYPKMRIICVWFAVSIYVVSPSMYVVLSCIPGYVMPCVGGPLSTSPHVLHVVSALWGSWLIWVWWHCGHAWSVILSILCCGMCSPRISNYLIWVSHPRLGLSNILFSRLVKISRNSLFDGLWVCDARWLICDYEKKEEYVGTWEHTYPTTPSPIPMWFGMSYILLLGCIHADKKKTGVGRYVSFCTACSHLWS